MGRIAELDAVARIVIAKRQGLDGYFGERPYTRSKLPPRSLGSGPWVVAGDRAVRALTGMLPGFGGLTNLRELVLDMTEGSGLHVIEEDGQVVRRHVEWTALGSS
jgi:hypothetical protein